MTACSRWQDDLIEHALGRPSGDALSAHLGACNDCSAALADSRARMVRLDSGLRTLAAGEPSTNLRSRVLAGIVAPPVHFSRAWRMRAAVISTAVIASIVLITYGTGALKRVRPESTALAPAIALSQWRAPTDTLLPHR